MAPKSAPRETAVAVASAAAVACRLAWSTTCAHVALQSECPRFCEHRWPLGCVVPPVELALPPHFIGTQGNSIRVEFTPACLPIGGTTILNVDAETNRELPHIEPVGFRNARRYKRTSASNPFRVGMSVFFRDSHFVSAPTRPPAVAPATAPAAVEANHPAATTGPRPGIASRPRPARRPAVPPTNAPMPAPPPAASARSSTPSRSRSTRPEALRPAASSSEEYQLSALLLTTEISLCGSPATSSFRTAWMAAVWASKRREMVTVSVLRSL